MQTTNSLRAEYIGKISALKREIKECKRRKNLFDQSMKIEEREISKLKKELAKLENDVQKPAQNQPAKQNLE